MGNNMPKSVVLRDSMSGPKPVPPTGAAMLTVPEACRYLRVSKWTLYRLMHAGKLKTVKIGSRRLVSLKRLQELVAQLEEVGGD